MENFILCHWELHNCTLWSYQHLTDKYLQGCGYQVRKCIVCVVRYSIFWFKWGPPRSLYRNDKSFSAWCEDIETLRSYSINKSSYLQGKTGSEANESGFFSSEGSLHIIKATRKSILTIYIRTCIGSIPQIDFGANTDLILCIRYQPRCDLSRLKIVSFVNIKLSHFHPGSSTQWGIQVLNVGNKATTGISIRREKAGSVHP